MKQSGLLCVCEFLLFQRIESLGFIDQGRPHEDLAFPECLVNLQAVNSCWGNNIFFMGCPHSFENSDETHWITPSIKKSEHLRRKGLNAKRKRGQQSRKMTRKG